MAAGSRGGQGAEPSIASRETNTGCPVQLCRNERRQGCCWLWLSCETQGHLSAVRYEFACLSRSLTPCQMSNRSPRPGDLRTSSSGCFPGCTHPCSLGGHLWPIWSLSALITERGDDCKAAVASVLSTSSHQPHVPCSEAGMSAVAHLSTAPFPLNQDRDTQIPHRGKIIKK